MNPDVDAIEEKLAESPQASSVELQERLIVAGDPTPTFQVGDILACQLRGKHDIFVVREITPAIIVGSISRETRLNMRNELDTIRPLVLIRLPRLSTFSVVKEGAIYQLLNGLEITPSHRRWVSARDGSEVTVGLIPRVVERWAAPAGPRPTR